MADTGARCYARTSWACVFVWGAAVWRGPGQLVSCWAAGLRGRLFGRGLGFRSGAPSIESLSEWLMKLLELENHFNNSSSAGSKQTPTANETKRDRGELWYEPRHRKGHRPRLWRGIRYWDQHVRRPAGGLRRREVCGQITGQMVDCNCGLEDGTTGQSGFSQNHSKDDQNRRSWEPGRSSITKLNHKYASYIK